MANIMTVHTAYGDIEFGSCEDFFVNGNKISAYFDVLSLDGEFIYRMLLISNDYKKGYATTEKSGIDKMAKMLKDVKDGKINIENL